MRSFLLTEKPEPIVALIWALAALFFTLLPAGCGNNKDRGIEVMIAADNTTGTGIGDGTGDYPDAFITPSAIKAGVKSVKLIKSGETDPSYTIFDTGSDTNPIILDLNSTPQRIEINNVFPSGCQCDYSQVQIEVTFFDIQVTFSKISSPVDHRIRFYARGLTDPDLGKPVLAGDVLISNLATPLQFNWVDVDNGTFVPLADPRPAKTFLQVPVAVFPDKIYSPTVTIDLSPFLTIPDKPKGTFTVKLTVLTRYMFFYDDTDGNGQFDLSTDGQLNANQPINSHYYPVYPSIEAAAGS
ncbi:MAG: hypothetical protein HY203_05550 [Nitrospirae bacterium]|nr:hypothetical protein [Nitrospirota bacterium]